MPIHHAGMMNHLPSSHGVPPAIPQYPHPHPRRQQEYHAYHHPPSQLPMNPYAAYPSHFYPHHGPPQYPQRWQHHYQAQYMPPQHPPQPAYQPRSPMVVSSQPYMNPATGVSRPTPMSHAPLQHAVAHSPRPVPHSMLAQMHPPGAPPSPAATPMREPEQERRSFTPQGAATQSPVLNSRPASARSDSVTSDVMSLPVEYKQPYYPVLPWYSDRDNAAMFPPRATRRRRRRQSMDGVGAVALPSFRGAAGEQKGPLAEELTSEASTITARSDPEPETPATSQAPSESDSVPRSTPATPAAAPPASQTTTPTPSHKRKDTRTAIAVPITTANNKMKQRPFAEKQETPGVGGKSVESATGEIKTSAAENAAAPVALSPKAAPKSWADLVRQNNKASASKPTGSAPASTNGAQVSTSASLADTLQQYKVSPAAKVAFLEPRGLVNTGNMCYMNSILQVLVFCVPFYNFLDQVQRRTVHSMKSDTPLVDTLIMFVREFKVLATSETSERLHSVIKPPQLEQHGDPVTPEYVYEAIRKLDRFNGMRRGHQQDAEEFLGFLLEGLHDECIAVIQGSAGQKAGQNGTASTESLTPPGSGDGWLEVGHKQKPSVTRTAGAQDVPSPITKIFGGHLRSELRVPGNKDSVTLEPYKPLQLDIGAPHVNNIVDALKGLTRTEALVGDFGGRSNSAKKQVLIDTLPPVLILHLKRFQYENNLTGTQKIWKKVGYPLELEIPKEVFPPSKRSSLAINGGLPKYRLISVVYHHGKSAAGGHYTVDVLRQDSREWVRMDDTVIRRICAEDVAEGGAEEDPKLLAKALEQHKADQEVQRQKNMYQGLDEADQEVEEKPWSEVNGSGTGHRKWNSVAHTNGTATPASATGKKTPTARKGAVRDNKVAYILFYERIGRG